MPTGSPFFLGSIYGKKVVKKDSIVGELQDRVYLINQSIQDNIVKPFM